MFCDLYAVLPLGGQKLRIGIPQNGLAVSYPMLNRVAWVQTPPGEILIPMVYTQWWFYTVP